MMTKGISSQAIILQEITLFLVVEVAETTEMRSSISFNAHKDHS